MTVNPGRKHNFIPWSVQGMQDAVLEIERGEGVYFWDKDGRRYLDFLSQIFNLNRGHGNRKIIEAIQKQAERLCVASPTVLHPGRVELGDRLAALTPPLISSIFWSLDGSSFTLW